MSLASRRLISLADLMKSFNTAYFLQVTRAFELLWHDERLVEDSKHLESLMSDEQRRRSWQVRLTALEQFCSEIGLSASVVTSREMRAALANPKSTTKAIATLGQELIGRLADETSERVFFSLSLAEVDYYKHPQKGWELIITRFPNTLSDVEESRKCYALSRYAASVYHSVQIVEHGLIELGEFIDVVDPKSGWTAVTNKLDAIFKMKFADRSQFGQQNDAFLEQVKGTIEGLKNAWRNKISHAQGRLALLTNDFHPDIAEEILLATRAFMRRLMEGLPIKQLEQ